MIKSKKIFLTLFLGVFLINGEVTAQIIINGKNEPDSSWMNQEIPAKKLAKKKYGFIRSVYQNLVTHFNYYYNARMKLSRVLEQATENHKDNYGSLLSFFPYVPQDFTAMQSDLDSVIYDAGVGIEIHDPRSKWIDNLYLLVGKGYYFKQDYDNAIASFKYIIKNEGPKNESGQPEVIGSREYTSQSNISIVTPEEKKLLYHTPSRNDAYIWLIRSYLATGQYDLASNLLNILASDPRLPERLKGPLATMKAWYELKQHDNKSFAALEKAISLQEEKHLKTRWEFLLSQLYEQNKQWEQAFQHYKRVTQLSAEPLMDFYAHLNMTRILILKNKQSFKAGSQLLLDMAKREKYARYRHIIYFNLGRLALQTGFPDQAIDYLKQSLSYNRNQAGEKLQSYKLLAKVYYKQYNYRQAKLYYDSAVLTANPNSIFYDTLILRKNALTEVVKNLDVIDRQDSLLRLASLPEEQLTAYLEQIVQDSLKARKKRNRFLKPSSENNELLSDFGKQDINNAANENENTAWYFYNPTSRSRGFSAFKSHWGKRPLTDNWRWSNAGQPTLNLPPEQAANPFPASDSSGGSTAEDEGVKKLMANIPLTPQQKKNSNDSIMQAWFNNATIFYDRLENDPATLRELDSLLSRFPNNPHLDEIYYRLYLLYAREGNQAKAAQYRQLLRQNFAESKFTQALNPQPKITRSATALLTARLYDSAYINYLAGNYQRTLFLRDRALQINPQNTERSRFDLLHAMTILKTKSDSAGRIALQQVVSQHSDDTAIAAQAKAMLNALNHKQELVEHLAHLQLPKEQETPQPPSFATNKTTTPETKNPKLTPTPSVQSQKSVKQQEAKAPAKDTAAAEPPSKPVTPYKLEAQIPYFVVLSFNHTNKEMITNALSKFAAYNSKQSLDSNIEVSSYLLAQNRVILIFRLFPNESAALSYYKEIRQQAPEIVPGIPPSYYRFFIISRSNFILLNNTQDYEGYLQFFSKYYR